MANVQRFDDLLVNMTDNEDKIDECVNELNNLLLDIFEKFTKREVKFKRFCWDCTIGKQRYKSREDKPWITDECKNLYRVCKKALFILI